MGEPVLSIGAVFGGPNSDTAWVASVKSLMSAVANVRGAFSSPIAVNVVFHVPGDYFTPDFTGIRTGSFSRKNGTLIIQVALPEHPGGGVADEAVRAFLREAVVVAEEFARLEGVTTEPLSGLRRIAEIA